MHVQRKTEARPCNLRCSGKVISNAYFEYVFANLRIQHAMRTRRILLSMACPAMVYFFHINL